MKFFARAVYAMVGRRKYLNWLPPHIRAKLASIRPDDVCVDCGANVGEVSLLFASYGATVHAFEPDPVAYPLLQRAAEKNPKIKPVPYAVGVSDGRMRLYLHKDRENDPVLTSTGSSLMGAKPNVSSEFVDVQVIDFAKFLRNLGRVKVLKIDIEGYETVLVPHLLKEQCLDSVETIFVETHERKWPALVEETEAMRVAVKNSPYSSRIFCDWP